MNRLYLIVGLLSLAGSMLILSGCSDDKVSTAEEQKMRQQMTEKFDINKVPPEQRDRVRAFMNMGKGGAPAPSAPGNTEAAKNAAPAPKQ